MRVFGKVSYFGKNYHGWQIQPNDNSIEEEIERCLSKILNKEINIIGAGRTDAGVHAKGQTFHFDCDDSIDLSKLRYSVNSLLDEDIHIEEFIPVEDDFHARYSAKGKHYQYIINIGEKSPFTKDISWYYPYKFSITKFKEALDLFLGKHDFRNFTSKEEDQDNFIREITDIKLSMNNTFIYVDLFGSGFMRYMIRDIIGTAIAYSSDKIELSYIQERLDKDNRNIVSYKANAEGLFLIDVIY